MSAETEPLELTGDIITEIFESIFLLLIAPFLSNIDTV